MDASKSISSKDNGVEKKLVIRDDSIFFFDCDDTIYFNDWKTAARISKAIEDYSTQKFSVDDNFAWKLYLKYGTALRGFLEEGYLPNDDESIKEYLDAVHNIPLDEISHHPELREILLHIHHPMWIFTASSRNHAHKCLKKVGVDDLFVGIIDCKDVDLVTKHEESSFRKAAKLAGVHDDDFSRCWILDDSVKNIKTAKKLGWNTVLVGHHERGTGQRIECPEADYHINEIIEITKILPELFKPYKRVARKPQVIVKQTECYSVYEVFE